MYLGYFDEFGHNGAYISRSHAQYKTHPVFGLGGFVLPADNIRKLTGAFRKIKESGLKAEIDAKVLSKGKRVEHWEKKGAALLTSQNISRYRETRAMIFRVLSLLEKLDAQVVFYGQVKPIGPNTVTGEDEKTRYDHAMKQLIRRINWTLPEGERHLMVLDKQGPRERMDIYTSSAAFMFSHESANSLLEPPFEVESHLYQSVQCADWICALLGRIAGYKCDPEFKEFEWAVKYFGTRLVRVTSSHSKIRAVGGSKDVYAKHLSRLEPAYFMPEEPEATR